MEDDHEKCLLYLLIIGLLFSFVSCNNETPSVLDGDDNTHPYLNIDKDGSIYCIGKEVTEAEIPEYFNGIKVTSIKDYAFLACKSLVSVKIPDSVKSIGGYAFFCCENLTEINIDRADATGMSLGTNWKPLAATVKWNGSL